MILNTWSIKMKYMNKGAATGRKAAHNILQLLNKTQNVQAPQFAMAEE
jgi:hypothetical protein